MAFPVDAKEDQIHLWNLVAPFFWCHSNKSKDSLWDG